MRRYLTSTATACLALAAAGLAGQAAAQECKIVRNLETDYRNAAAVMASAEPTYDSVIVRLKPGVALGGLAERMAGAQQVGRTDDDVLEYVQAVPSGDSGASFMSQLGRNSAVASVEPNYRVQLFKVPNDPCFERQWHYRDRGAGAGQSPGGISLPATWETNTGANPVVVAVIDTGLLYSAPDINRANLVPGADLMTDSGNGDGGGRDMDPTDPNATSGWHGTHVAGTIGALFTHNRKGAASVGWTARVQPVRVLGGMGGTIQDVNDGILWAVGIPVVGVRKNATPAKVLNLSLGGIFACPPSMQQAIDAAVAAGTLVVVAAGNNNSDAAGTAPANCNGVLTVAALDAKGRRAFYSNYGATVDIAAPGGDTRANVTDGVLSSIKGGFAYYQGTSMAAPHVAGVAALLMARTPGLSPAEAEALIKKGAVPITCPEGCGAGQLDARVAK